MARVCAHCGELYPDERPNCPHCGADADLTYVDEPDWDADPEWEQARYRDFLEREGLAEKEEKEPRGRPGCGLLVAGAAISGILLLLT